MDLPGEIEQPHLIPKEIVTNYVILSTSTRWLIYLGKFSRGKINVIIINVKVSAGEGKAVIGVADG